MHFSNNRFLGVLTNQISGGWYELSVVHLSKKKANSKLNSNSVGHIWFNHDGRLFFAYFPEFSNLADEILDFVVTELSSKGLNHFTVHSTIATDEVETSIKTNGIVNFLEMLDYNSILVPTSQK